MKEFEFIELLKKHSPPSPAGIGDDAAVAGDLLIAKDLMVEGVHFTPSESIFDVAGRLFASNISDIAAMGGVDGKYRALLGLAIPKGTDKKELAGAVAGAAQKYGVSLIGGDSSASKQGLFLSLTIIGLKNKYLLTRGGAKPGDTVYLSRPVGGAQYELRRRLGILKNHPPADMDRSPERELGELLGRTKGITSCIDISDGLGRDLSHIAESSGVRVTVDKAALPLPELPLSRDELYEYTLSSGEEYALLFTASPRTVVKYDKTLFPIGKVSEGSGCFMDGTDISQKGYEHE